MSFKKRNNSNNRDIALSEVVSLYGVDTKGKQSVTLDCPACGREKRFNINFERYGGKGAFRCPACAYENGTQGKSPVTLYGLMEYQLKPNETDAKQRRKLLNELLKRLNLGIASKKEITVTSNKAEHQSEKASADRIHAVYSEMMKHTILYDDHFNDLIKRGLNEEQIDNGPYRSFPFTFKELDEVANKIIASGLDVSGVPGFYLHNNQWKIRKMPPGLMIFHKDVYGRYNGVQIRIDIEDANAKYLWLYSHDKHMGCSASAVNNFAGYPEDVVIITEGGLKANVINALTNKPVISIPGISTTKTLIDDLKYLQSLGVKSFLTAIDMDYHDNVNVARGRDNLHKILEENGFKYAALEWAGKSEAKGLDDYLYSSLMESGKLRSGRLRHKFNNNQKHINPDPNSRYNV